MNKFLKSMRSATGSRDDVIKKAVIDQLKHAVKEIQYGSVEENRNNGMVDVTEAANNLCSTIEAMFLHGLKDSLSYRFKKVLADMDERPEPSFWAPLLVISHRQIIDQITGSSQITTEVGQCRAWIRLVLNDCLLSSYLSTLQHDTSSLKSFYRPNSFVRDSELLEVAERLIEGIEAFKSFALPTNSSLLNKWSLPTLMLAGIWVPAMKASSQVAHCDDVAQCLDESMRSQLALDTPSDNVSLSSAMSIYSHVSSLRQVNALTEDEILKIILANPTSDSVSNQKAENESTSSTEHNSALEPSELEHKAKTNDTKACSIGNQLNKSKGWSLDENQPSEEKEFTEAKESHVTSTITTEAEPPPTSSVNTDGRANDASFKALIESYNMMSGGYIKTPDIKEVWQKFNSELNTSPNLNEPMDNNNKPNDNFIVNDFNPDIQPPPLSSYIGMICREKGLDTQNYECSGCRQALNVNAKPRLCAFTGDYFCDTCMSPVKLQIPARIIHNWDFKFYDISQNAFNYIDRVKDDPLIDFKVLNPHIYGVVEEMTVLQSLRNQLNFLRAYLYTCREPVIEELQKQMAPKDYMYEHIHQYSIADLFGIENNDLPQQLSKVISFGREHVMGCWLCSQKGFVCEICKKPKPLFPFDVEHVRRCDMCNAVYHKGCFTHNKPCPKCKRKKKHEETPAPGATV